MATANCRASRGHECRGFWCVLVMFGGWDERGRGQWSARRVMAFVTLGMRMSLAARTEEKAPSEVLGALGLLVC